VPSHRLGRTALGILIVVLAFLVPDQPRRL
jgi:hypothetical protein